MYLLNVVVYRSKTQHRKMMAGTEFISVTELCRCWCAPIGPSHTMVKGVVPCASSLELGNYLTILPIQSMEDFSRHSLFFLMSFSFSFVRSHVFLCALSVVCALCTPYQGPNHSNHQITWHWACPSIRKLLKPFFSPNFMCVLCLRVAQVPRSR